MTIEETVERFIADFERDKGNGVNYLWQEAFDSALLETESSRRLKSIAFAETLLYGRRRQLQEFVNEPHANEELQELQVAIERLRRIEVVSGRAKAA